MRKRLRLGLQFDLAKRSRMGLAGLVLAVVASGGILAWGATSGHLFWASACHTCDDNSPAEQAGWCCTALVDRKSVV